MRTYRTPSRILLASALALLAACGSNSTEGLGFGFTIESCTLGCSDGQLGPVTCGLQNIAVNESIRVVFSAPVDFASVTKETFQVTTTQGVAPAGEFLQGNTPSEVVFRPLISFDSSGNPTFGLQANKDYEVLIPGTIQNPNGPWITSETGAPNANRLKCFVISSEGVLDQVPGSPTVAVFVEQCTDKATPDGDCLEVTPGVLANGLATITDVWRDSTITMVFDDIMNPATLINPVTGTSDFITVKVDPDGDVGDSTDQLTLFGTFTIDLDFDTNKTTVLFVPATGLPSAGSNLSSPRQIVVSFSLQVQDLGGNTLANGAPVAFVPERIGFDPVILPGGTGEDFTSTEFEDTVRSGAKMWGTGATTGVLLPAATGGSGRLGDFEVAQGQTLNLGSDGTITVGSPGVTAQQIFGVGTDSATELYTNKYILDNYDPNAVPPELPGTGLYSADDSFVAGVGASGIFEFASLIVRSGGRINFEGQTAPRLLTRGSAEVQGTILVAGGQGAVHKSNLAIGGSGAQGGPGGGSGGKGGDRFDYTGSELLPVALGGNLGDPDRAGIENPGFTSLDGQPGEGVGGSNEGFGPGGVHWPEFFPGYQTGTATFDGLQASLGDFSTVPFFLCKSPQVSAPAGGGAYSSDGGQGVATNPGIPVPPAVLPYGPSTPGGSSGDVTIGDLSPESGNLRGGSGGGGGGTHIFETRINGVPQPCTTAIGTPGSPLLVLELMDHSGAGGGGGGGAVQLQAGRTLSLSGTINASGGKGGGADISAPLTDNYERAAQAGGGGSGGAVLLQGNQLSLAAIAGRFDLRGGSGGAGPAFAPGGTGGAGVARVELTADSAQDLTDVTDSIVNNGLINPPGIANSLGSGTYVPPTSGPSTMTGAQSCWLLPEGNFFEVKYDPDVVDSGTGDVTDPGWDMDLVFVGGGEESWRTTMTTGPMAGSSWEDVFGTVLRAPNEAPAAMTNSPIVVRFQGVRAIASIADPCGVQLSGATSPVLPESLTPWVYHPVELTGTGVGDGYWDLVAMTGAISASEAAKRRPNMVRFQIVFDAAHPSFDGVIEGITNLYIDALPD